MADNAPLPLATGSTRNAATDQVTYSGDLADVQLVRLVDVTGAEGSKAVGSLTLPVSAVSLPLPAGAATEASAAGIRTDLGTDGSTPPAVLGTGTGVRGWLRSIYEKLIGTLAVTGTFWQATQPVSAASLPLPSGAATETTLAALNTKVTAVNTNGVVLAAGSAIAGKFGIDQTTPGTTNAVALTTVGGTNVNASPVGFQRVTDEPRAVFYDPFESLDTTDRWTITSAGGGVAPAVAAGRLTVGSGTTINGYAYATSQPTFLPAVPGWLGFSFVIKLESAVGTNAVRFWGMGVVSGSVPSSTNPLGTTGNGMGFEVDIAGVLSAVMYSSGVRTVINALASNQPSNANDHRYIIAYRTDRTDFYIDGLGATQLVATASFQSPAVQVLSCLLLSVAHSTAPAASRIIDAAGLAVWDTAKGNTTISDGALPHRKVTVKKPSTAAATTDSPMVVALHPSSPLPAGSNLIGGVTISDLTASGSLAALNATLALAMNQAGGASIEISGTWSGTISLEGTVSGSVWNPINGTASSTSTPATTTTVNGLYRLTPAGLSQIRVNMSAFASGSATISMRSSAGTGGMFANQILPIKNTDGVSVQAIKAASTAAAFTDAAAVVDIRPGGVLAGMGASTTTGDTGAKTATGNGATQTNTGNKGLQVVIVLGTVSGVGPTAVFKLQSSVDGGTNWVDVPGAVTASISATGNFGISVYPGQAVTAGATTSGTTATASGVIPRSWRVVWSIGGTAPSFTITSITYNYLPN